MSTATKPNTASRLAALNAVLDAFPTMADAARELPETWRERAGLLRAQEEQDKLAAMRAAEQAAQERAAAFLPTIEKFRKRVQPIAQKFNADTAAIKEALAGMKSLQAEYGELYVAGRAAGAQVPPLAELSGIGPHRLQRVEFVVALLDAE